MPIAPPLRYKLHRRPSEGVSTIGEVTCGGDFRWYSCEDVVREPPTRPPEASLSNLTAWVATWKVPKETAIPADSYRIIITHSERFDRPLMLLVDVPGFSGIRIHSGNTAANTEGCLLPGLTFAGGQVMQSKPAVETWQDEVDHALLEGREVWIDIFNAV